jgi:aspartyl-tRNA(Asn)/glutamyl-tRNA(Gln) amidotransferase subunit B
MELKRALKWVGVSDCEMQEGSLRCDANVSVRPKGQAKFGTRVEIKNLNSFRGVEAAIIYEIQHQTALMKAGRGDEIKQVTKLWDPILKSTKLMRSKEEAADYRYFPDPDLPPLVITSGRIEEIRKSMPELPRVREERFIKAFAFERAVAHELTAEAETADYFEKMLALGVKPKLAANWTREEAIRLANESHKSLEQAAPSSAMAKLIVLVDEGKVARVVAKAECTEIFRTGADPEKYFTERGMIQVQDSGALSAWVAACIKQEDKVVADVKGGKLAAIGRLVGVTMKLSGGKAEPNAVKAEILKQLGVGS